MSEPTTHVDIPGQPFSYDGSLQDQVHALDDRVARLRETGSLDKTVLQRISKFFRIRSIYNSNAIEGNQLSEGETRLVIEQGLTIAGRSLKDHLEATNLANALDFFESIASNDEPITESDIRQVHQLILKGISDDDAGRYRSVDVMITGSAFKPTAPHDVSREMGELGAWVKSATSTGFECSPVVLATAAHARFAQIHPFIDGNGRTARILMNLLLMRSGYPIAVITKDERQRYYESLEESQSSNLTPFLSLVIDDVSEALDTWEEAAREREEEVQSYESLAERFRMPIDDREAREFEVFRAAMELLRSQFAQAAQDMWNYGSQVYFKDFDLITQDRYLQIKRTGTAKRTWFFRVDFRHGSRSARYLFWFVRTRQHVRSQVSTIAPVSVIISREDPSDSFFYSTLDELRQAGREDVPDLRAITFDPASESYYSMYAGDQTRSEQVSSLVRSFVSQVVQRNFQKL
ncbi:MAG: Fic family protein [Gemmatimonadetes bacterium]|nr:Fic family protein [Dehalococcoidia bacterium]MYJ12233.1 Fic family protein [Gemmatimonadota bacterium]